MDKIKCLRCDSEMQENAEYNGLIEWSKEGKDIVLHKEKFLPVNSHICETCGYVELRLVNPNEL